MPPVLEMAHGRWVPRYRFCIWAQELPITSDPTVGASSVIFSRPAPLLSKACVWNCSSAQSQGWCGFWRKMKLFFFFITSDNPFKASYTITASLMILYKNGEECVLVIEGGVTCKHQRIQAKFCIYNFLYILL